MSEITYGTVEDYGELDWVFWATITVDDVPRANGVNLSIQYNQNEFKKGSFYCTAYMCFTVYSAFTGNRVSEDMRKGFIDICLKEELIIEWEGGYLHKVFHRWVKYLEEKMGIKYNYLRVEMGSEDARKLLEKGYAIGTGFKVAAKFNQDKNDNCVIDKIESVEWTSWEGHALGDYGATKHMRMDNYEGVNTCNVYQIIPYDEFVGNENLHFKYGYILTSLQPQKMSQAEQDQKDLETAKAEWIYTKEELLDKPVTMRQAVFIAMRLVRYVVKLLGK